LKDKNVPQLLAMIERGYDIVAPIPSCVLMFKQELPLMFPDDAGVAKIKQHIFDPFEYLAQRHKAGLLRTISRDRWAKSPITLPAICECKTSD
jgi:glycerol-3-phosphate dehydrogenase subunit C